MEKRIFALVLFAAILLQFSNHVLAQQKTEAPLEITADQTLEWKRDEKLFIANGNAVAKQGDAAVNADALTAHYKDNGAGGGMQIWQVTADRGVVITSKDSQAYGDAAIYDLDKDLAVMTGENLRMTSPGQTVTAQDRFEYWVTEGKLNAIGNARMERRNTKGETDTLAADTITAILKDNQEGQRVLDTLEATGNVVITTPTETIRGARGLYRAGTNMAELSGGVTIERGQNTLKGERAEVDMTTNTSRLFGGEGKQVKGVFYPGSAGPSTP